MSFGKFSKKYKTSSIVCLKKFSKAYEGGHYSIQSPKVVLHL